jgi:hypothetical protein
MDASDKETHREDTYVAIMHQINRSTEEIIKT